MKNTKDLHIYRMKFELLAISRTFCNLMLWLVNFWFNLNSYRIFYETILDQLSK